jgi:NitT/TauT family transport system permease protein
VTAARLRGLSASVLYPLAGFTAMLAGWHALVATGTVPEYLLPSPLKVGRAIVTNFADGTLAEHLQPTLQATVVGYLVGAAVALALAALIAEFRTAERFLLLHLVAIQSIPKVAIAPLVFLWAGFDISGKVVLVALVCFFPIFANALTGFRTSDPNLIDLMRAAGAPRRHIFWEVKLPTAATHIFAGLEVAVAFALIGCVVMEFVGSTRGMGFVIQNASNSYDIPLSVASIVLLGLVGVAANALVRFARRRIVYWERGSAAVAQQMAAQHA